MAPVVAGRIRQSAAATSAQPEPRHASSICAAGHSGTAPAWRCIAGPPHVVKGSEPQRPCRPTRPHPSQRRDACPSPPSSENRLSPGYIPDPPPLDAPIFSRSQCVAARLESGLTPEMPRISIFFSMSARPTAGPLAQRMYVFEKQRSGELTAAL